MQQGLEFGLRVKVPALTPEEDIGGKQGDRGQALRKVFEVIGTEKAVGKWHARRHDEKESRQDAPRASLIEPQE